MRILVVNGPNLNLLGTREPDLYGTTTLPELQDGLTKGFPSVEFTFFQSNHEGELIDALQHSKHDGIVLNAAGFTHTSVALRDAIASIEILLLLQVLRIMPRSVIGGIVGTTRKEATAVRRSMTCQERRALDLLDGLRGCCHAREDGAA